MGRWLRAQIHPLYFFINILQSKKKSRDIMNVFLSSCPSLEFCGKRGLFSIVHYNIFIHIMYHCSSRNFLCSYRKNSFNGIKDYIVILNSRITLYYHYITNILGNTWWNPFAKYSKCKHSRSQKRPLSSITYKFFTNILYMYVFWWWWRLWYLILSKKLYKEK